MAQLLSYQIMREVIANQMDLFEKRLRDEMDLPPKNNDSSPKNEDTEAEMHVTNKKFSQSISNAKTKDEPTDYYSSKYRMKEQDDSYKSSSSRSNSRRRSRSRSRSRGRKRRRKKGEISFPCSADHGQDSFVTAPSKCPVY